jgi:hypothetical protein
MAGGAYARVVAVAVAAGAAALGFPAPVGRGHGHHRTARPVDPGGRRCGITGDTVFVEPGNYAEPGIACPANLALTCGVAIAKDGISLIGLMHGRRQAGCRPVDAAPYEVRRLRDDRVVAKQEGRRVTDLPGTLADFAAAGRQNRSFRTARS